MVNSNRLLRIIDGKDMKLNPEKFFMLDQCGFFICTEGTGLLSFVNKTYEIHPGSLALFYPFVKISFMQFSEDIKGFWSVHNLKDALPVINQVLSVDNVQTIKSEPVVYINDAEFEELLEKVHEYLKEHKRLECEIELDKTCNPICKALLKSRDDTLMLEVLYRYYLTKSKSVLPPTSHELVFRKFIMDLRGNYTNHRDTMFYASRSSLSPKYFSFVIKETSGAAPLEWIIQTVISIAQDYLADKSLTIKEISAKLGFPSQGRFCKYFKRYTSLSPKEYRMAHTK